MGLLQETFLQDDSDRDTTKKKVNPEDLLDPKSGKHRSKKNPRTSNTHTTQSVTVQTAHIKAEEESATYWWEEK